MPASEPSSGPVVAEFLRAATDPRTYDPRRNAYLWFGFLWGLPIPVAALAIDCRARGLPFTAAAARDTLVARPFHVAFLLHPLLFASLFAVLGAIRSAKDRQLRALLQGLEHTLGSTQHANERLTELSRARDREVAHVTHELKSPISTIRGWSELLLSEQLGGLDARQREALAASLRGLDSLNRMIDDMLVASALDEGSFEIRTAVTDLGKVLDGVLAGALPVAQRRRIALAAEAPPELAVVADSVRLEHALGNLVSNALRFTPAGGHVRLWARREEGSIRLGVTDDGPGISPSAIPHLGQRFYQAAAAPEERSGGTGLGLCIVKGILAAHGAKLDIDSALGRGTTMSFLLAAAPAP